MTHDDLLSLIKNLESLRVRMREAENEAKFLLSDIQPHYHDSARNFIHYMALRSVDLRPLQSALSSLGLSSLSHSERYSYVNVTNILYLLYLLIGKTKTDLNAEGIDLAMDLPKSRARLEEHTVEIFGEAPLSGNTRIMVTLPTEASLDGTFVEELLVAGVDILRINCSQDSESVWLDMMTNVREAEQRIGKKVLIYMDLAGPKIRTGAIKGAKHEKRPFIHLNEGDVLEVHKNLEWGRAAQTSKKGKVKSAAKIGLSHPELFDMVQKKELIWFDDGKLGGVIEHIDNDIWQVRILVAPPKGAKLRARKGINLPDTEIRLPALAESDLAVLPFAASHADMIGFSFVQKKQDLEDLKQALIPLDRPDLGIILKIETQAAFQRLPELLLAGMQFLKLGVMIARGDLAVEVGWSRSAEVQEEIGWLCEAAHIPNIWATQILENLAKNGVATRAEITDAVAAVRAECAMLNKGPHILKAIRTLQKISTRMEHHQYKRRPELRKLSVADAFLENNVFRDR